MNILDDKGNREIEECVIVLYRMCGCPFTDEGFAALASALKSNVSYLRELNLSENKLGKSVDQLSAVLEDLHCQLEKLWFRDSGLTDEDCASLTSALRSNPSHLRQLDLSGNKLGYSVKLLSAVLKDPRSNLEKLWLVDCGLTDKGCAALASALRSNPEHLRQLSLSGNKLGDSVNLLSAVLEDPDCKVETLGLMNCCLTDEGCAALASALRSNPEHLRELNLSENNLGDSGVNQLSAVLKDSRCKLEKLWLRYCGLTNEGCVALASVLKSKFSHLRHLDLSENMLRDEGLKLLSVGLKNSQCKLEILELRYCCVTDKGCGPLASALESNPSHLRELHLNGNHLEPLKIEVLTNLVANPIYRLEKLNY
ncbi:hypothetical protein cypCar_00042547 [Cyprinus carpio]|nr:hypothetical protein cypCar_00042547 [Cyprinus carpio]